MAAAGGTLAEHEKNWSKMLSDLSSHVAIAVANNKPLSTPTTQAWRESVSQITTVAKSMSVYMLSLKPTGDAAAMRAYIKRQDSETKVSEAHATISGMTLVFKTAARAKLQEDAAKALDETVKAVAQFTSGK
jgi:hypothetical protein